MDALWDEARAAMIANGEEPEGVGCLLLHNARNGHINAAHILRGLLADVSGCPCGADDLCDPSIDTPERIRTREALAALLGAMTAEAA